MKIYAFHLLNDYSGSPKVLMQLLNGWVKNGLDVTLVTCSGRKGFLSGISGVKYHFYWYRFAENRLLRLFFLTLSQLLLLIKLFTIVKKDDLVYINTVFPFGAAFLAKIKGCRVIYHIHETTVNPPVLKKFLFGLVRWVAHEVVYVSKYLAEQEKFENKRINILYNVLENSFLDIARTTGEKTTIRKNVLMVCSLKEYKGVNEFVALSKRHPYYRFTLVVNARQEEIDSFFRESQLPENIEIFPTQTNVHPFCKQADVVLNLSRPDGWIETFGLTIIEGMAYGLPAIVPPVGGITELVEEGKNGFQVDSRNALLLSEKLTEILENEQNYFRMRRNALEKVNSFREYYFVNQSLQIINRQKDFLENNSGIRKKIKQRNYYIVEFQKLKYYGTHLD